MAAVGARSYGDPHSACVVRLQSLQLLLVLMFSPDLHLHSITQITNKIRSADDNQLCIKKRELEL